MVAELASRFVFGGLVVSLFALLGEMASPKTFAGLFGAAPSVALVTIGIALSTNGPPYVVREARSMILGAVAMLVYCFVCARACRSDRFPTWLEAGASWGAWFAIAFALYAALAWSGEVA